MDYAGASIAHNTVLISSFGAGIHSVFAVKIPRRATDLSGVVTPVITVDYTTWLAGQASDRNQDLISDYAHSAGPAPTVTDNSVIEALNRIYPLVTENNEISLLVNDKLVDWTVDDWEDRLSVQNLIDLMRMMPVQEWAAPNDMQGMEDM